MMTNINHSSVAIYDPIVILGGDFNTIDPSYAINQASLSGIERRNTDWTRAYYEAKGI